MHFRGFRYIRLLGFNSECRTRERPLALREGIVRADSRVVPLRGLGRAVPHRATHGFDPRTAVDGPLRECRAEGLEAFEAHAAPLLKIGLQFSEHRGGPRPDLSARTTVRDERLAIPSIEVRGPLNEAVHDSLPRERQDRRIVRRGPAAL